MLSTQLWCPASEYVDAVQQYDSQLAEGEVPLVESSELLSCFEGLFPPVAMTDASRNLKPHLLLTSTQLNAHTKTSTPSSLEEDVVSTNHVGVGAYVWLCCTLKLLDLSRTVLQINVPMSPSSTELADIAKEFSCRKFSQMAHLQQGPKLDPVYTLEHIHRFQRDTSGCGFETILVQLDESDDSIVSVDVSSLLSIITNCLAKNSSSGAYVILSSPADNVRSPTAPTNQVFAKLASEAAFCGLNYYLVDKGVFDKQTQISVLKLVPRVDAAGPSMASTISLNQFVEDRQRHGEQPIRDSASDETDDEFQQRVATYAQCKREFERKFLLTSTNPVIPPSSLPGASLTPTFDVVVQGMGLVEALLVVALARSGKRVLHVCGEGYYGSSFASTDLFSFHRDFVTPACDPNNVRRAPGGLQNIHVFENDLFGEGAATVERVDGGVSVSDREKRQFIVDLFPLFHFSRSDLFNLLVDSKVSPNMDMMLVDRVLILSRDKNAIEGSSSGDTSSVAVQSAQPQQLTARERLALLRKQKEAAKAALTATATDESPSLPPSSTETQALASSLTTPSDAAPVSSSSVAVQPVPFSRADVFRQQSSSKKPAQTTSGLLSRIANSVTAATGDAMGLLEMRKLMKFIRDLEKFISIRAGMDDGGDSGDEHALQARIGETKDGASVATTTTAQDDERSTLPWERSSQDPLEPVDSFLKRVYGISDHTCQLLLLGGLVLNRPPATLSDAINTLALAFSSVGRFDGLATPFLVPLYGTGELVQTLCTRSSSWLSTTILRRCLKSISNAADSSAVTTPKEVILSNGEKVLAKAVVIPRGLIKPIGDLDGNDKHRPLPSYHRAVLVSSAPIVSWKHLEDHCNDTLAHVDDAEQREQQDEVRRGALFPTTVAVLDVGSSGGRVIVYQLGMSSEHAPYAFHNSAVRDEGHVPCLLHFVSDAASVTRKEFDDAVEACMVEGDFTDTQPHGLPVGILRRKVLYRIHFTLDGEASVVSGGGGVEGFCELKGNNLDGVFEIDTMFGGSASPQVHQAGVDATTYVHDSLIVPAHTDHTTAVSVLDDGWYAHTSGDAYHSVQSYLWSLENRTSHKPTENDRIPHHCYMPFFEQFPDPSDRWYAGHELSDTKPKPLRSGDGADDVDGDGLNDIAVAGGASSYEVEALQFLRAQHHGSLPQTAPPPSDV